MKQEIQNSTIVYLSIIWSIILFWLMVGSLAKGKPTWGPLMAWKKLWFDYEGHPLPPIIIIDAFFLNAGLVASYFFLREYSKEGFGINIVCVIIITLSIMGWRLKNHFKRQGMIRRHYKDLKGR